MHPVLFQFGPLKVYAYGLSVALGFIVSTYLARQEARRQKIEPEKIVNLALGLIISGIIGARILYVVQNLPFFLDHPGQILMLHKGGLSFYGGFFFAIVFAIIFLRKQGLGILSTFDLVSPYLALAQAIGRIGCFLNGCCYGKPTTLNLGVYFPGEHVARHPVQIYSSFGLLLIFVTLRLLQSKRGNQTKISGQIFFSYALLYSSMRFFIEFLRGDNLPVLVNLTLHQLISIVIFISSGIILWRNEKFSSPSLS